MKRLKRMVAEAAAKRREEAPKPPARTKNDARAEVMAHCDAEYLIANPRKYDGGLSYVLTQGNWSDPAAPDGIAQGNRTKDGKPRDPKDKIPGPNHKNRSAYAWWTPRGGWQHMLNPSTAQSNSTPRQGLPTSDQVGYSVTTLRSWMKNTEDVY